MRHACLSDEAAAEKARVDLPDGAVLHGGEEGLVELATMEEADIVLIAIVGVAGLKPRSPRWKRVRIWLSPPKRFSSWPASR